MAKIKLDLFRFDEAVDTVPHRDLVDVDVPETTTVLDALETAKAEVDGSISFRRSCRSAICGSCSMNINGITGLACKTQLQGRHARRRLDLGRSDAELPAHEGHGRAHGSVLGQVFAPQALPAAEGRGLPITRRERRVSPEDMKKLVAVANCVMCATCYALCPVVSVDPAFAGPAAIAYAYRFIEDVRDGKRNERIAQISEDYLWLCAHCYACSYCPKHVDPQRPHHRRQARGDQRQGADERARSAPRAGRREDDQTDRHARRDRSHLRHGRPLQRRAACSKSRRSACAWRCAKGKMPPCCFLETRFRRSTKSAPFSSPWRSRFTNVYYTTARRSPLDAHARTHSAQIASATASSPAASPKSRARNSSTRRCCWPTSSASS